jgi:predicted MFS family arabinose efflux permease
VDVLVWYFALFLRHWLTLHADIVPLRDFALWRSLIICIQAVGDVTGGPVGSAIADKFGWRA